MKNIKKINFIGVFMCGFMFFNSNISHALDVEPYKIPGVENAFWDEDVPSALILKSAGDGLAKGTILYRNSHEGIDYYSPVPPESLQGTISDPNNGKYNNWGPWNMTSNNTSRTITSKYYYATAKLKKTATIYTDNGSGSASGSVSVGTLPTNTPIEVLAIQGGYVYFDLTKHPTLERKGITNVARVAESSVTYTSSKQTLVYSGSSVLLQNFKPMAKYTNNMRSVLKGIVTGRYKNPSYAPSAVKNLSGEWRYLGYNAEGEPLDNPYFITDMPSYQSLAHCYGYPWRLTPWNPNDKESGESNPSYAYQRFTIGAKSFRYDTDSKYASLKQGVIDRMVREGYIKSASDYKSRISLRTFPTKQPAIISGQRKDNTLYRVGFMPLEGGLRDIYIKRMTVKEEISGQTIATWTCGVNGGCSPATGTVEKGKSYIVEVVLANGANSELIKNTLEAQIGYVLDSSGASTSMPYANTRNRKALRLGNKGNMYGSIHSESAPFSDKLYVSKEGTIDVYGYVGGSHTGVDNLKYDNDLGVIRLTTKNAPPPPTQTPPTESCSVSSGTTSCTITNGGNTKICGGGDLRPYAVKVFSKTENGKLVYLHNYGESSPVIREAMIPGYEYRVVYNVIYEGSTVYEYDWIPGTPDNPDTPNINEYVPGRWSSGRIKEYEVPIKYSIEKYSGGPRDLDAITKYEKGFYVVADPNDRSDLTIPMVNGAIIGLYADIIMYQHPYLKTTFNINLQNSRINPNGCNDSMTVVLNDNFDISVSNLRVSPSTTYTDSAGKKVNYNITYDANLTTPSYVQENQYQASINTAIKIGGNTYYVKDQLLKGSNNNKNITHIIEGVTVPASGQVTVSVNLNYDKKSYETGNYSNNIASTNVNIVKVKDPGLGSPTDTVKTPDSLNSNNANKGGDANNNCLTPRTKNTWTSTHRKFSWNSNVISYNKISSGAKVQFNKYYTTYNNLNEATETYTEEFGIQKILFRSKETREKKYGNDGWVDLLNSREAELAEIKAGYGFELQIVTKYSTDALSKRTWTLSNNGASGTSVSALNGKPNYGLEDVFLELPGTSTTRKILSSTGYGSTTLGLISSKKVTGDTVEWTYTIKPANTVGIGETAKIYIPSETKDGDYTLKIYTPPVPGATSVNKKTYSALCDRKEVIIKVKGSAMNDLNSHETQ